MADLDERLLTIRGLDKFESRSSGSAIRRAGRDPSAELHDAIDRLAKVPRAVVYLDAGAADAVSATKAARLLRRAGVSEIQGFFPRCSVFFWPELALELVHNADFRVR
ncbi:MAG: hypothetical protein WBP81_13295 [Solirubrobacteraceae bacterium]